MKWEGICFFKFLHAKSSQTTGRSEHGTMGSDCIRYVKVQVNKHSYTCVCVCV